MNGKYTNSKALEYISTSHLSNSNNLPKLKKPSWIRVKAPISKEYLITKNQISKYKLHTVCQEASCPNIGECWSKSHATVMILGDICTRKCGFCNVKSGKPKIVDKDEPNRLANAISKLNLKHVVITSVDRDDLVDGGANQFKNSIIAIRNLCSNTTIEVLVPDFQRKINALELVLSAYPDVINHNLETVPRLYKTVRRAADYDFSLQLLSNSKRINPNIFTKSGIMLGLGEKLDEVENVLKDLRKMDVDFVTIGQYLQPTEQHLPVKNYVSPEKFKYLKSLAYKIGFLMVSSSALTRSSYHADADFKELKTNKITKMKINKYD